MPQLIDTLHNGRDRAIGVWDLGGLLVDPGPESCLDAVLAGVSERPRALLLTHIHLDHAGATGAIVRRFPDVEVYVHERGAPHLIDPSRLIASARPLYGERFDELWGEIVPVPEANVHVLSGGETIDAGGRSLSVSYSPGHASHHVVYFDRADGTLYAGDIAGVRIPPSEFVMAPTPPPDIDLGLWRNSVEAVRAMRPNRLAITHFGMVEDVEAQLDGTLAALDRQARVARQMIERGLSSGQGLQQFSSELKAQIREASDEDTANCAIQASPPDHLWLGLERYWRKQGVGETAKR